MRLVLDPDRQLVTPARAGSDGLEYDLHDTTARAYTHGDLVEDTGDLTWLKVRAGDLLADLEAQGVTELLLDPLSGR